VTCVYCAPDVQTRGSYDTPFDVRIPRSRPGAWPRAEIDWEVVKRVRVRLDNPDDALHRLVNFELDRRDLRPTQGTVFVGEAAVEQR
jgi:hypothetical protein